MLTVDPALVTELSDYDITPVVFVTIEWSAGTVYLTDAPTNVTVGANEFNSDGGLLTVSPPATQGQIDRDIFNVTLSDITHEYRTRLLAEAAGVPVTVVMGFALADGSLTTLRVPVYKGVISGVRHSITDDQSPISAIECTGPLTKLTQATHRSTTEDSQKFYHSDDTCFDRSFDTENKVTLQWGGLGGEA